MPLKDLLVMVVFCCTVPLVLYRARIGIYLWNWLGYMNPHKLGWGAIAHYPLSAITAAITFVSMCYSKEIRRVSIDLTLVIWFLFLIWISITTYFAIFPELAKENWGKVMKIQLMTFVALLLINDKKSLNDMVWVIALSLGFFGIKGGIFTVLTGGSFMVLGPPYSFISGNTEIGFAMVLVLPILNYLRITAERPWIRHGLLIAMILCGFSIVGSQSRGAFLAGGVMAMYLWLKSPKKFLFGVLMVIAVIFMLNFMPDTYHDKMATIETYKEDASAMGRINAWWFAYNLSKDRPITGGGFNCFEPSLFLSYAPNPQNYHDAHSIYFEILGEHGYPGLILFLSLFILTWRNATLVIRATREASELAWMGALARMIQVSLVGYSVGGAFLGLAYFDLLYHFMMIPLAMKNMLIFGRVERLPAMEASNEATK